MLPTLQRRSSPVKLNTEPRLTAFQFLTRKDLGICGGVSQDWREEIQRRTPYSYTNPNPLVLPNAAQLDLNTTTLLLQRRQIRHFSLCLCVDWCPDSRPLDEFIELPFSDEFGYLLNICPLNVTEEAKKLTGQLLFLNGDPHRKVWMLVWLPRGPETRASLSSTIDGDINFLNQLTESAATRILQFLLLIHFSTINTTTLDFGWKFQSDQMNHNTPHCTYLNPHVFESLSSILNGNQLNVRHIIFGFNDSSPTLQLVNTLKMWGNGKGVYWDGDTKSYDGLALEFFQRQHNSFDKIVIDQSFQLYNELITYFHEHLALPNSSMISLVRFEFTPDYKPRHKPEIIAARLYRLAFNEDEATAIEQNPPRVHVFAIRKRASTIPGERFFVSIHRIELDVEDDNGVRNEIYIRKIKFHFSSLMPQV